MKMIAPLVSNFLLNATGKCKYFHNTINTVMFAGKIRNVLHVTKRVKIQVNDLMKMLEAIEVLRDRYSKGMWGYCGEQGAKELIANITGLKGTANDSVVILCDRDRFLYCHPRFGKCQCIKANRGFQEVASSFWEQTEGNKIFNQSIGNGQCALITGSDCPIHRDLNHDFPKKYPCEPGNRCLYKANKKPCDTDPKHIPKSFRTDSKTQRRLGSELETSAQDYQRSSSEQNAFIRQTLNQNTTTAGAMKYRIFRSDFPSVHCQCYGYIGGGAVDYVQSGIGMSFGTFWIALFFLFKP